MKCTKCNAEIREGAKFCTSCGEPVAANREEAAAALAEDKGAEAEKPEAPQAEAGQPEAEPKSADVSREKPETVKQDAAVDGNAQAEAAKHEIEPEPVKPETEAEMVKPEIEMVKPETEPAANEAGETVSGMEQLAPETNRPVPEGPKPVRSALQSGSGAPQPGPAPGTVKEGKKFGKAIIGVLAAVVVVVIAAFAALHLMEKDPKDVVITAFENIHPKGEVYPTEELFGTSEMVKSLQNSSSEGGMTLKLSDSSQPFISQFAGSGLKMSAQNNLETKESAFNVGLFLNDMELVNMDAYYGNDKVIVALPEISSKAFTLDLGKDLAKQIKDSPVVGQLAKDQGVDVDGLVLYIEELKKQAENKEEQSFNLEELLNRYKEGCKAQDNFKAAMTVTKGEKQKFTVDGKEVNCKGYNTVISKDSMIDFLDDSSEFFLEDETLREDFLNQLEMTVRLSELMGESMGESISAKELRDQTFAEAEESAKEMIKYLDRTLDDVDMVVYVDRKGRLAAVDGTTTLHIDDTDVDVKFHVELNGGAYLTQNMSGTLEMEGGGDVVTLDLQRSGKYDKKNLTDELSISADTGSDTFDFTYAAAYTADDGSYDVSAKFSANGTKVLVISAEGAVDEMEKGKSFHMDIDKLKLTLDGGEYITFKGEYYLRPLEDEIRVPKGEPMDVLAADEMEWVKVIEEFMAFSPF